MNGPAKFANYLLEINQPGSAHEVRILTEDIEDGHDNPYVQKARLRIPKLFAPIGQWLRMGQYYRQAMHMRAHYRFDCLVYINAFNGWFASRVAPVPVLAMVNDDNNLKGGLQFFALNKTWLKRTIFGYFERGAAQRMPLIISNSDYLNQLLIAGHQLPPGKVHRLYKAIDFAEIPYNPDRAFGLGGRPIHILFVKADFRRGGLEVLIKALAEFSHLLFKLTIIGPNKRFEAPISTIISQAPNVEGHFLAEQPQAVVKQLMQEADIFCVPALKEALGVANMEAAAAGLPIVSTMAGGIPEVLDYGAGGFLAQPGNVEDLVIQLKLCIEQPRLRLIKQTYAHDFIKANFNKQHMLAEFLRLVRLGLDAAGKSEA